MHQATEQLDAIAADLCQRITAQDMDLDSMDTSETIRDMAEEATPPAIHPRSAYYDAQDYLEECIWRLLSTSLS
ncbi:MAG: hypothetical protein V3V92_02560 [Candidatus Hydrothermarchaeales archaeon]